MKKSIIFFAALAALFSCTKENPVSETPAEETFSVELFASAPAGNAETKTTLVDGEGTKFVHWSKGDEIKVLFFPGRHDNAITGPSGVFSSHFDDESSASANFRIKEWSFGMDQSYVNGRLYSKGIAVYPSSANASSTKASGSGTYNVSDVSFTLPSEQKAIENNIESNLNFSYADVDLASFTNTINNPSHQTKLMFNNVCALIQLTMPAQMPKVTEIVLTSNDKVALTGHGSMNYMNNYNQEVNGTVAVTNGGNVVLKNADGFKAGATYYAVVWPGVHNSGLTIEFMAEDGTVATKTTPSVTLTASKVKPYTFNKGLNFIAPVQEFNYIYADGTTGNDVKSNIVGVVIYRGNPKEKFNDPDLPKQYCNGLAISTKSVKTTWGGSSKLSNIPVSAKLSSVSSVYGGFTFKKIFVDAGLNLPIYNNSSYDSLSSVSSSGWYLGTKNEWDYIYENRNEINALLAAAGCSSITFATGPKQDSAFWLPIVNSSGYPWLVYENYGKTGYTASISYAYHYVSVYTARPIFAF